MNHPSKHAIRVASVQLAELHIAMRWYEALPKDQREEVRTYLNSIPSVKATTAGIGRYWKLTQKDTVK